MNKRPLILASASKSRANMLRAAGVAVEIVPAHADEDALKNALKAEGAKFSSDTDTEVAEGARKCLQALQTAP